jgi:hypothetical protein
MIRYRWNKKRTEEELGPSRVGLHAKLERYGLMPASLDDDDTGGESAEAVSSPELMHLFPLYR